LEVAALRASLARLPEREGRLVMLVGGEPFLRPDALRLIGEIKAAGCVPGMITTGRPLVYAHVREKLRRAGLAYLRMQFFGVGETHDRATAVAGGFEQALAGLRAWVSEAGAACDVDVALTVRNRSPSDLASELERLAREIPASGVQVVVALDAAARAELSTMAAGRRPDAALAQWNADPTRPVLAWEGLPESTSPAARLTIAAREPRFLAVTPQACCLGRSEDLTHASSAGAEGVRANSFNFVRTSTAVPWTLDSAACTAYRIAAGADAHRHLWLIDGERLVLHATDTGDFSPAEIARVKDEWSHLFLDRAPAGVLDDFHEGMRRVMPDPTCDACAQRAVCARRFHIVEGRPFARQEEWIARYVASLRGRVLDVGCGEQLYRGELAPLVRTGAVRYTGLDPDEPSLAAARAALPEGRFLRGGIEDFRGTPASYEHILCLRSVNHVVDLDEAVARLAELLAPGGSLLMVECTPFAMLRRSEQVTAADRAPRAGHQHFRNATSEDVLPFARRHALRVVEHQPAGLQATNEWILLLQRPPTD